MSKQLFQVGIQETLYKVVTVEAESADDACEIAHQRWLDEKDEKYVLDAEDFVDVDFTIHNPYVTNLDAEFAQTEVLDIKWALDSAGIAIPKIIFRPVILGGETVSQCDCNAEYVQRKQIGNGAIVEIAKQGRFAPFLKRVVAISGTCEIPVFCPHCHSELKWYGVHLRCVNPYCREFRESEECINVEESQNRTPKEI